MAQIILFMCACVFKNIIYLWAHLTQLCLCLFCPLSAGKRQLGELCTPAAEGYTFAAWVRPGGAARPFVCGARAASVASVGTLPIGIIQQQARFRCGHGCFSRRAFLFPFPPHVDSDRSVAAHRQHVSPFLTTLRCRKTRRAVADYCRLYLQEWFTGTFGVLLPPGNYFEHLWLQRRATCSPSEPSKHKIRRWWATPRAAGWHRRNGCMSCGCCTTQRWEQVRKSWQWHLLLQQGPPGWTFRHWQGSTRSFSVSFVLKAEVWGSRFLGFLGSSSCLFTKALPVWRSASWLVILPTKPFKFGPVINDHLTGACPVCLMEATCSSGVSEATSSSCFYRLVFVQTRFKIQVDAVLCI